MQRPNFDNKLSHETYRLLGSICLALSLIIFLGVGAYAYTVHQRVPVQSNNRRPSTRVFEGNVTSIPLITCQTPQHTPGNISASITSGGQQRTFIIHLAPSYGRQPQALVINYHAYSLTSQSMAQYTNMAAQADKAGFILIFPQGVDTPPSWNVGIGAQGPTGDADDVQFTRNMLNYLEKNYCVDTHRIYVTGYSLGAGMAYRVACTLSTQITALATVAGAYYPFPGGCNPSRPIPVLEIHGEADNFAPYNGNPTKRMEAVQDYLNAWLQHDACSGTNKVFFQQGDVTAIEWTHCAGGSSVVHYRISDGGHTWPGATRIPSLGYTTHTIDANGVIWNFFSQYTN